MKDLLFVQPEMVLIFVSCIVLMADLFVKKNQKWFTYACGVGTLLWTAAYVAMQIYDGTQGAAFSGLVIVDPLSIMLKLTMLLAAAAALCYSWAYLRKHDLDNGEYVALVLFGTLGMLAIASAGSMLTAYLGLEILSLSMYALVALKRDDRIATEAGMKYFVLGALASGLLLFGISIIYGATGSIFFDGIQIGLSKQGAVNGLAVSLGLVFIACGVAFKLGVVPFHMWVPDVYSGAPTAVTMFLGTAAKVAAFALAYRLFVGALGGGGQDGAVIFAVIAMLSVVLGNLIAIAQTNIKRMLAYSAVANMGFMLLGFVAGGKSGYSAALFYTVSYVITGLVSFGVLTVLSARGVEMESLEDIKGLNDRSPWYAFLMLIAIFSLAGIPPTLGFWAKLEVLEALVNAGYLWIAVVAVMASLIGAFYYLRVIRAMYFQAPNHGVGTLALPSRGVGTLISINALAILALGLFSTLLSRLAEIALK